MIKTFEPLYYDIQRDKLRWKSVHARSKQDYK